MPYRFVQNPPRGLFWLFGGIWTLATIILLGSGVYGLYENHLFAVEGVQAHGQIENKFRQARMTRYGGFNTQRFLSYSYSVGGVSYLSADIPVASGTWNQFAPHEEIPICYLRDNPGNSRIDLQAENGMYEWFSVVLIFLGGLFLVGGIGALKKRRPVVHIT